MIGNCKCKIPGFKFKTYPESHLKHNAASLQIECDAVQFNMSVMTRSDTLHLLIATRT
jgi:hypothetical protein